MPLWRRRWRCFHIAAWMQTRVGYGAFKASHLRGPWRGNYLVSAGWHHFDGAQSVQHVLNFGTFLVTNFSSLGPVDDEVKMIPQTKDRGIRALERSLKAPSSELVKGVVARREVV